MTFFEFSDYLINFIPILLLFGVVLGVLLFKKIVPLFKALWFYLILMLLTEFLQYLLGYILRVNNQVVLPIYSFIELCFFLVFYNKYLFKKKHIVVNVISVVGALYIVSELLNNFVINHISPAEFQPYAKVVDNFVVVMLALTFLYEKMSAYTELRWENFRLNMVFLLFFTLNTIIFLPFNFLVNEDSGVKFYFWAVNAILVFLFYSYLIYEIWTGRKKAVI